MKKTTLKLWKKREKYRNKHRARISYKKGGASPPLVTSNKKPNCSPGTAGKTIHKNTCFTPEIMIKLKAAYNNKFPKEEHITTENPNEIWQMLHDTLGKHSEKKCKGKKENCWIDVLVTNAKMNEDIKDLLYRPEQPKEWANNPDEWLSNYDIFEVAKQYEKPYPHFKMIAPTSIDFDDQPKDKRSCVSEELCHFDLGHWKKQGKTQFGIVFNLDKHYEPGSHWVTLWIDVPANIIVFFDSAAGGLPTEIESLIDRVVQQGKSLSPSVEFKVYENGKHGHQKGNSECGMYALFFIITMLTGETPEGKELSVEERVQMFMKGNIKDERVFDYRDLFFNPPV